MGADLYLYLIGIRKATAPIFIHGRMKITLPCLCIPPCARGADAVLARRSQRLPSDHRVTVRPHPAPPLARSYCALNPWPTGSGSGSRKDEFNLPWDLPVEPPPGPGSGRGAARRAQVRRADRLRLAERALPRRDAQARWAAGGYAQLIIPGNPHTTLHMTRE